MVYFVAAYGEFQVSYGVECVPFSFFFFIVDVAVVVLLLLSLGYLSVCIAHYTRLCHYCGCICVNAD